MKRGRVSPLVLLFVAAVIVVVGGVLFFRPVAPPAPEVGSSPSPGIPPRGEAAGAVTAPPAMPSGLSPALSAGSTTDAAVVTSVSTSAIAAVASLQAVAVEEREAELTKAMNESYRKLGELRRAVQESPEIRDLQVSVEADRRAFDELVKSDPGIQALTDRRKVLLDDMAALQVKQSELARAARADATNMTLKAEGQAAMGKIRETSAELGAVTRKLETAKREYSAQNAAAAEIAARLAAGQEKIRTAVTANPEIQAIEQQIQRLAAESRQLGLRRRRVDAP